MNLDGQTFSIDLGSYLSSAWPLVVAIGLAVIILGTVIAKLVYDRDFDLFTLFFGGIFAALGFCFVMWIHVSIVQSVITNQVRDEIGQEVTVIEQLDPDGSGMNRSFLVSDDGDLLTVTATYQGDSEFELTTSSAALVP